MRPLIGIMMRCSENANRTSLQYVYEFVRTTIIKAGGEPFILTPPQNIDYFHTKYASYPDFTEEEKRSIDFYLDCIQGLFLPGGSKFTEYDRYVLKKAIEKKIPVLGVCLGMQMMSCYEKEVQLLDAPKIHDGEINQQYVHKVVIDSNSRLYQIIGKNEILVNSFHARCASENEFYKTVATSSDGVIEALEYPGDVFHIGVQWHPEKMYDYDIYARKLIDAFIDASRSRETLFTRFRKQYYLTDSNVIII